MTIGDDDEGVPVETVLRHFSVSVSPWTDAELKVTAVGGRQFHDDDDYLSRCVMADDDSAGKPTTHLVVSGGVPRIAAHATPASVLAPLDLEKTGAG